MKPIHSIIVLAALGSPGFSQTTFSKGFANKIEVPIAEMTDALGFPILTDRDVDHATVAMNDNRDIVVTYHTMPNGLISLALGVSSKLSLHISSGTRDLLESSGNT